MTSPDICHRLRTLRESPGATLWAWFLGPIPYRAWRRVAVRFAWFAAVTAAEWFYGSRVVTAVVHAAGVQHPAPSLAAQATYIILLAALTLMAVYLPGDLLGLARWVWLRFSGRPAAVAWRDCLAASHRAGGFLELLCTTPGPRQRAVFMDELARLERHMAELAERFPRWKRGANRGEAAWMAISADLADSAALLERSLVATGGVVGVVIGEVHAPGAWVSLVGERDRHNRATLLRGIAEVTAEALEAGEIVKPGDGHRATAILLALARAEDAAAGRFGPIIPAAVQGASRR